MVFLAVIVLLVVFGLLVAVSVISLVNTYLPRPPGGSQAERLAPYLDKSLAEDAQQWLSEQSKP
jgi:hypothetical protein